MNHANAIDKSSNLRVLPLPGRHDVVTAHGASAPSTQQPKGASATDSALAVAGRSQQAENFLVVSYGPLSVAQAANLSFYIPRTAFASGRQPLADPVVNYLLRDQEEQAEQSAAAKNKGTATAAGRYQSAAAGFPHSADSLFSLIG
ncbi:MAG: hypothetical protein WBK91_00635 [Alphaproteobacteria bacterium]